jgi:hypothetical protein
LSNRCRGRRDDEGRAQREGLPAFQGAVSGNFRHDRSLEWLGAEAGIQGEVRTEVRNLDPGETIGRTQRGHGHEAEEQHDTKGHAEKAR